LIVGTVLLNLEEISDLFTFVFIPEFS